MSVSGAMEPSLVTEIAAAVRAVPGVQEAVAVVRQSARTLAPSPHGAPAQQDGPAQQEGPAQQGAPAQQDGPAQHDGPA
ncbi:hypothetical protein N4P33_35290, partial [Streptomyces sp. 15-116A]|nr:hypothetical protein [Streptomyces sp. 15-116A]